MLTRQEFQTIYEQGSDAVFTLFSAMQAQMDTLQAEVNALQDRLGKDSHHSSKLPASDGLARKPVSLRQKTRRKPGGQSEHPGRTLALTDTPDELLRPASGTGQTHEAEPLRPVENEQAE